MKWAPRLAGVWLATMLCGAAGAQAEARPEAWATDPRAASLPRTPERDALLRGAERALDRGDTAAAASAFERAAAMQHAADAELGLVRAAMQAGDYRQALTFCAHTVGEHLDSPAAAALYAWLLRAGGQQAAARRVLAAALVQAPQDAIIEATRVAFDKPSFTASGVLLEPPHRMAPHGLMDAAQAPPPAAARLVAGGVLIDGGRRALVPLAAIDGATSLWVRNGLGRASMATPVAGFEGLHSHRMALLQLAAPLAVGNSVLAPRDAFAGSPGIVVGYSHDADASPSWPALWQGFLGAGDAQPGLRELGIEVAAKSLAGAVVFDPSGRVVGIAVPGGVGAMAMLPVSMLHHLDRRAEAVAAPSSPPLPAARIPLDEVYERGLKIALQVLALR